LEKLNFYSVLHVRCHIYEWEDMIANGRGFSEQTRKVFKNLSCLCCMNRIEQPWGELLQFI